VPLWQLASVVFLNARANVHCVNACVCFEANKYSSSSSLIPCSFVDVAQITLDVLDIS